MPILKSFLIIFQISMSHPLDRYQKSLWHVHHVCYCFEFHSSGIRRSCERRVAKKCIPGKSRLRFHGYFYDGVHSESKASFLLILYIKVKYSVMWDYSLCLTKNLPHTILFHRQKLNLALSIFHFVLNKAH